MTGDSLTRHRMETKSWIRGCSIPWPLKGCCSQRLTARLHIHPLQEPVFWTGCYAHRLGEACNLNSYFPRDLTVYPELLGKAGYMTVYWHKGWGPGVFSQTGWKHNPAGHEVQNLAEWIEQAPADKPICAWMGSRRPHRPYSVGSGEEHGFCPDSLKLCPDLPDAPAIR